MQTLLPSHVILPEFLTNLSPKMSTSSCWLMLAKHGVFTQFESCDEVIKMRRGNTCDTGHTRECAKAPLSAKLSYNTLAAYIPHLLQSNDFFALRGTIVRGDHWSAASCYARAADGLQPCTVLQHKGVRCRRGGGGKT